MVLDEVEPQVSFFTQFDPKAMPLSFQTAQHVQGHQVRVLEPKVHPVQRDECANIKTTYVTMECTILKFMNVIRQDQVPI